MHKSNKYPEVEPVSKKAPPGARPAGTERPDASEEDVSGRKEGVYAVEGQRIAEDEAKARRRFEGVEPTQASEAGGIPASQGEFGYGPGRREVTGSGGGGTVGPGGAGTGGGREEPGP